MFRLRGCSVMIQGYKLVLIMLAGLSLQSCNWGAKEGPPFEGAERQKRQLAFFKAASQDKRSLEAQLAEIDTHLRDLERECGFPENSFFPFGWETMGGYTIKVRINSSLDNEDKLKLFRIRKKRILCVERYEEKSDFYFRWELVTTGFNRGVFHD